MLYVKLFGAPSLAWAGKPFKLSRRQGRALLYRLAADSGPVARSQLTFLLWPDLSLALLERTAGWLQRQWDANSANLKDILESGE